MKIEEVGKLPPLERLIYWIKERESIRLKKEAGNPKPWTDDKILQSFRFCNVRRADDKVSRWLISNWYTPNFDHSNMLVACALARFINQPSTLESIQEYVFTKWQPDWAAIKAKLGGLIKQGSIFNGAYIVAPGRGRDKIESVVDLYAKPLYGKTIPTSSMQSAWTELTEYEGFGSFMAGQVVGDLRFAMSGTWSDKNNWAPMGPGSKRGMNRLHSRPPEQGLTQDKFLKELRELVEILKKKLPTSITSRLEMLDWQNCLCEFGKMEKAINGEGNPKQRYQGKAV